MLHIKYLINVILTSDSCEKIKKYGIYLIVSHEKTINVKIQF
jgi:hypothetical protein